MEVTTAPFHPMASHIALVRTTRIPSLGATTKQSRVDYGQRTMNQEPSPVGKPALSSSLRKPFRRTRHESATVHSRY